MTTSLNDKPNRVTVSGDSVTVTAGSGIQGPQGAQGPAGVGGTVAFFGNFFSTETQNNADIAARNTFTLNSTVDSSGVSIVDGSKITFGAGTDGTYDLQFSAQFDKTDSGTDEVDIWISKNGTDLEWSNTVLSLVGNNAKAVPAWNWQLNDVTAGDFFQLHWWSPDSAMRVLATAAGTNPTRPAVPSLIVTVAQVLFAGRDEFVVSATAPSDTTVLWADTTEPGDAVVPTGGTTGQVLAKASNSDYDTTWSTPSQGVTDATYVTLSTNGTLTNERVLTAGTGISITDAGAGSTVTVATSAILPTIVDAAGDLIVGTGADTVGRLAVGANGTILTANSASTSGSTWVYAARTRAESNAIYFLPMTVANLTTSSASFAQIATWYPYYASQEVTIAGILAIVQTLEAGSSARVGIYSISTPSSTTFSLVSDYGTLNSGSTGNKVATGSTKVGPGWFLICAWASNHSTVRWNRPISALQDTPLGSPDTLTAPYFAWRLTGVDYSAGLPATASPTLTTATSGNTGTSIGVGVRYA